MMPLCLHYSMKVVFILFYFYFYFYFFSLFNVFDRISIRFIMYSDSFFRFIKLFFTTNLLFTSFSYSFPSAFIVQFFNNKN